MNHKIKLTNWQTDAEPLSRVRRRVFIEEQNVSEEDEWDQHDLNATHFLVVNKNGDAIGCARVLREESHTSDRISYHIGRVAVLVEYRQKKIGRQLMQFILAWCQLQESHSTIYLHAQTSRIQFYEHLGFVAQGDVFMDAGIEHIEMRYSN